MSAEVPAAGMPILFFLVVFALSIPFWLIAEIIGTGLPLGLPLSALMFPCPLFAASLLVLREEGRGGVKRLLARILDVRRIERREWLVPAFLLVPAIYLISFLLHPGAVLPDPGGWLLTALLLFVVFFVTAAFEEAGWTGYATDPLQKRWSALTAAALIGVVWSAWHTVPDLQAGQPAAFIIGQRSFSVLLRIVIVWNYNNAGRSVFVAVIVHAMDNVSVYSLFPGTDGYDPLITMIVTLMVVSMIVFLWGPRTLARFRYARGDRGSDHLNGGPDSADRGP